MSDNDNQWYFDPATHEVTQGKQGSWENRMGPYASREEAASALERAAARNDAFDAQDDEWEDD